MVYIFEAMWVQSGLRLKKSGSMLPESPHVFGNNPKSERLVATKDRSFAVGCRTESSLVKSGYTVEDDIAALVNRLTLELFSLDWLPTMSERERVDTVISLTVVFRYQRKDTHC